MGSKFMYILYIYVYLKFFLNNPNFQVSELLNY